GTSLVVWVAVATVAVGVLPPGLLSVGLLSVDQVPGAALLLVLALATEAHLRSAGSSRPWARSLVRPGLALQRWTTREPTAEQLEVALAALEAVAPSRRLVGA